MTFVIPAINNGHLVQPDLNARFLALIGTPINLQAKTAGNLPVSDDAGRWDNNTLGSLKGVSYEFQAAQASWDVSGDTRIMVWHHQFNAPNRIQIDSLANSGFGMRVYSGTGSPPTDYKEYQLGGNDTPMGKSMQGVVPLVIDLNDTSNEASNGTFDNTAVTSYAVFTTRFNEVGTGTGINFPPRLYVFTTTKGSADTPTFSGSGSDFLDAVSLIQGSDFTDKLGNWVRRVGSVVFVDVAFRIGNNSTITTFNDGGLTIISPVSDDATDPRNRLTTQACRVYLNLRSNSADTATFSGTYFWGTRAPWDFDQDDLAVVTFSSPTFNGMGTFTIGSSITGPALWENVDTVVMADTTVDVDGSTFLDTNAAHALQLGGVMDITNMTFMGYASATAAILIDTEGDYIFSGCNFDDTGTDIDNSAASILMENYATSNQDGTTALNDTNVGVGQSFNSGAFTPPRTLSSTEWYLSKTGTPTGNAVARLYAHSGALGSTSVPTGAALATSEPVDVSTLTGSLVLTDFDFKDEFDFATNTDYVFVIEYSDGTSGNFVNVGDDGSAPTHAGNMSTFDGTTWSADSTHDAIFTLRNNGIVKIRAESGSDPNSSIETGSPRGVTIILFPVNLTVTVRDTSGALLSNVRVAIYTDDAAAIELMNEDTVAGVATQEFFFVSDQNITVRVRESPNTASGRYFPFFTTGVVTSTGYTIDVILQDDNIATVN